MPKKRYRKKIKKSKDRVLDRPKLLFILLGTIFILFGVLVGDFKFSTYTLPFYYPILLGLFFLLSSILIFIKEKQIKI